MQVIALLKSVMLGTLALVIVVAPFFLFGFFIHLSAGFDDSLDDRCEISNIHAQTYALFAPEKFWSLQAETQRLRILALRNQPSTLEQTRTAAAAITAAAVAEVRASNPELFRGPDKSPAQRQADELRQAADDIELREAIAKERLALRRQISVAAQCRTIALSHVHK